MSAPVTVSTENFAKRNCWTLPTGELGARGGLVRYAPTRASETVVKAFSVHNQRTGEPWHYVVSQAAGSTAKISVYDENLALFQTFDTLCLATVETVTWATVEGYLAITSPSFATIVSQIGTSLAFATKGTSAIPGRVTLDVPRGICVSWAGRLVISTGLGLLISDGLQPTVFDPVNVLDPPGGVMYGLHVGLGGDLLLATTEGTWGLPFAAATIGADVRGSFTQRSKTPTFTYNSTAADPSGALYGLTVHGFRRIDTDATDEVIANEPVTGAPDPTWTAVAIPDFRYGRLNAGQKGPILSIAGKTLFTDTAQGLQTWWSFDDALATNLYVTGVLRDVDGMEFYTLTDGFWTYGGSEDVTTGHIANGAVLFGRQATAPAASNVVRSVDFATDADVGLYMAVPRASFTFSGLPQAGIIIGTGSWGDTYQETLLRSRRGNFAVRLDQVDALVRVTGPLARLGSSVDIWCRGPGASRRTG